VLQRPEPGFGSRNNAKAAGVFRGFRAPAQKLAGRASCSLSPRALSAYIRLAVRKAGYGDKRTSE